MKPYVNRKSFQFICVVLCLCALLSASGTSSAQLTKPLTSPLESKPGLEIEASKVYVTGFPAIIKIYTRGPIVGFPKFSLFSPVGRIKILLTSKQDGQVFSLYPTSTTGSNFTYGNSSGQMFSGEFLHQSPQVDSTDVNMRRLDLLDLSSIRSQSGSNLDEIPDGNYSIQLIYDAVYNQKELRSSVIGVSIRKPSSEEKAYLDKVKEKWLNQLPPVTRRVYQSMPFRNWDDILQNRIKLEGIQEDGIGQEAKDSIFLYKVYHSILSREDIGNVIEKLRKARGGRQGYLQDVFSSLIIELRLLRNKGEVPSAEISKFVIAHPGLEWRIRDAQSGQTEFSEYMKKINASLP